MKHFLYLIFIFSACNISEDKAVIPKDKMIDIMEEVYLLENYYQMTYGSPSTYKESLDSSYHLVLKENGVTKETYEESYSYYSERPEIMLEIQQKLIDRLNKKRVGL